jgi:hypothetical protein
MLVADYQNHRIVAVGNSEPWKEICCRFGTALGELRHPIAVQFTVDAPDAFWVADQMNHRIQEFDLAGNHLRSIGGALVQDHLIMPESIALLTDTIMAVSQSRFTREINLFSKQGILLDHFPVDYAPAGMLFHHGLLFVTDWMGNYVRVYELR